MKNLVTIPLIFMCFFVSQAQSIQEVINQVDLTELTKLNREYSGEDSITINGNRVLLLNRVSNQGNDLAADFLEEYFEGLGLPVTNHNYREGGRNVVATQFGVSNPDSIIIICAHYDAVANYCADDNVSGVAVVLETARILSQYCMQKTIIYALWDEEEIGLVGSRAFADSMITEGAIVNAVLNMDMMAYDGNDDHKFDIDVRDIANSYAIRDTLLSLVEQYNLDLDPVVVDPGTFSSDHSGFWQKGYSALLLGESWETNDRNPKYHTAADRVDLYNWPYYHEMAKLATAYVAAVGEFSVVDTSVTTIFTTGSSGVELFAELNNAEYQWLNCATNQLINGATEQSYFPTESGEYAVIVSNGNCSDTSNCRNVVVTSIQNEFFSEVKVFPNPIKNQLEIQVGNLNNIQALLFDATGKQIIDVGIIAQNQTIDVSQLSYGIYLLKLKSGNNYQMYKLVKH